MRGDLSAQGRFVGGPDQPGPARTRAGTMAPGFGALAAPTANRGWIDLEVLGNVTHSMAGIHRGQGSFTDVV